MAPKRSDLLNITLEIEGEKQLSRALGIYAKNVKDLRGVWPDLQEDFLEGERKIFKDQRTTKGKWKRLSSPYREWKAKRFRGRGILIATGNLMGSLTKAKHPNHFFVASKKGMTIGSAVPYASYHQTGTSKMPKREVIRLRKEQKSRWPKLIHQFIVESGQGFIRVKL